MSNRHDFYGPIHKGLRFGTARLLIALGSTDWRDPAAVAAMLAPLKLHLALAKEHLEHEDDAIHPALRDRAPGLAAVLDEDHAHHYATFAELDRLIAAVEAAYGMARLTAGRGLYLRFTTYFADDLEHMAREETEVLPVAQAHFSDRELMDMENAIIASIEPERLVQYFHIMLPGMNPAERAEFLRYVGSNAPAEAFAQIRDVIARDCLTAQDYDQLVGELALAA